MSHVERENGELVCMSPDVRRAASEVTVEGAPHVYVSAAASLRQANEFCRRTLELGY